MKVSRALAASLLILVPLAARAAPADTGGAVVIAAALKKLEAARATLAEAVRRIENDPPETADLETAHAAVGALKEAIDAGAEHQQQDLDLAKAVLAARKELRTHRDYVEQRRANVHIHDQRRTIELALTTLNDRGRATEGKDATAEDFAAARAAADALKKAVEDSRQFTKQDPKFATYLGELDATLARQGKALDERWVLRSADKHRGLVAESREALAASLGSLSKTASDEQFADADKASSSLAKLLEEGRPLEAADKSYRAAADAARKELTQAKKRMDELWSETGLTRLKAEIEPAHQDLAAAAKAVRARKPTADQLAEAQTAAIVVRKLLEKFQAAASRSQALAQYLGEVKKTLVEVEVELQRRSVDAARAELAQALKRLAGRAPTDEQFEEASSAAVVLEKTLESLKPIDPAMSQPVADAKAELGDARASMASRRVEIDVQRQRARVEEARKKAADLIRQLAGADGAEDRITQAEAAVKDLGAALEVGAALTKRDREYAAYDREVKERIKELAGKIANRRLVLASSEGRKLLKEATTAAKTRLDAAKQPEATEADLAAATESVEALGKEIEARALLEKTDQPYAAQANKARDDFFRLSELLEFARQAREVRRQTAEPLTAGAAAFEAGASSGTLRGQKEQYEKASVQFKACESSGRILVKDNRALETLVVLVEGRRSTAKDVIALCRQRLEAAEKLVTEVKPLIAFDEGPKKSFEAGKELLARSKPAEALRHFNECISSGLILQNRNPELKERKFDVAGGSLSLAELIQQCISQQGSLKGK